MDFDKTTTKLAESIMKDIDKILEKKNFIPFTEKEIDEIIEDIFS